MPGPKPLSLTLSDTQRALLQRLVRRQTSPHRLVWRAQTMRAAAEGAGNAQIAQPRGLHRNTVRTWRKRWCAATENLDAAEAAGGDDKARRAQSEARRDDAPRPGAPGAFTPEQLPQLIAGACEAPADAGRPVTHWTPRELAHEVIKRGIVDRISPRTVGRFLKRSRSQAASLALLVES